MDFTRSSEDCSTLEKATGAEGLTVRVGTNRAFWRSGSEALSIRGRGLRSASLSQADVPLCRHLWISGVAVSWSGKKQIAQVCFF